MFPRSPFTFECSRWKRIFHQDFLMILCQWHHCRDAESEPSSTQGSFGGISLPFGWCTQALLSSSSDVAPQRAAWIFPSRVSWGKLEHQGSFHYHLLPLILEERKRDFLIQMNCWFHSICPNAEGCAVHGSTAALRAPSLRVTQAMFCTSFSSKCWAQTFNSSNLLNAKLKIAA